MVKFQDYIRYSSPIISNAEYRGGLWTVKFQDVLEDNGHVRSLGCRAFISQWASCY
jgi:hypothetical protein